ncbi:MAG: hypothetical protein ACYC99_17350 [Candidatus Geothermincolia bacterium]
MSPGDKVRYYSQGRAYLAEICLLSEAHAYIRFLTKIPPDELGRRPRKRALPLEDLVAYGTGGIAYTYQEDR